MGHSMPFQRPAFYSRPRISADVRLSGLWHCEEKTAKMRRLRAGVDAVTVVEVFTELGQQDRIDALVGPIEAAAVATPESALSAVMEAAAVDSSEDPLTLAFVANPCRDTALSLYRRKLAEANAHLRAAYALRKEYGF